jgi:hypothetical protein
MFTILTECDRSSPELLLCDRFPIQLQKALAKHSVRLIAPYPHLVLFTKSATFSSNSQRLGLKTNKLKASAWGKSYLLPNY